MPGGGRGGREGELQTSRKEARPGKEGNYARQLGRGREREETHPPTQKEEKRKKISCGAPPGYRAASPAAGGGSRRCRRASSLAGTDMVLLAQGACCSNQWLAAVLLSLCSCLPVGQSVDFPWAAVDNMLVRKGDTAVLR